MRHGGMALDWRRFSLGESKATKEIVRDKRKHWEQSWLLSVYCFHDTPVIHLILRGPEVSGPSAWIVRHHQSLDSSNDDLF
jgi:hypothetical protein